MKTAKVGAAAIYVPCPYCQFMITSPSGSQMLTPEDFGPDHVVECDKCGKLVKLPKTATVYATGKSRGDAR